MRSLFKRLRLRLGPQQDTYDLHTAAAVNVDSASFETGSARAVKKLPFAVSCRPDAQVHCDHLEKALYRKNGIHLDATILRTSSVDGRDLLAWQASRGAMDARQIVALLEAYRDPVRRAGAQATIAELLPDWTMRLARVMALQQLLTHDCWNALGLFEALLDVHGKKAIRKKDALLMLQVALAQRAREISSRILEMWEFSEAEQHYVLCDLHNPFVVEGQGDFAQWLSSFNTDFLSTGGEPIGIDAGWKAFPSPFDALHCEVEAGTVDGPLVTVIVTCWRPDESLITAVKSILKQSWKNLEVIIVDDGSPAEYAPVLERCRALSDRIRIVSHSRNNGTYVARNTAISVSNGDFVTFQDSDDWSHPRRIERQMMHLLANPQVVANRTMAIRVDDRMMSILPGSLTRQGNASSILFRKEKVIKHIGYFDQVRKGADTEYALRIEAAFPGGLVDLPDTALAVIRLDSRSLSRAEFKPGWRHPARSIYREAYEYWHAKVQKTGGSLYIGREPMANERPFPAPRRFWVDQQRNREENAYDYVFVGDWRSYGGPQKSMIEEILALKRSGARIAVCHLEAFRFMTTQRQPKCLPVRKLIHDRVVDEVLTSDQLEVGCLILRYPPILQYMQLEPAQWHIGKAMVVVNQAPREVDGSDVRYNVSDALANFRRVFGCDATWVPQGPLVRNVVRHLVPPAVLSKFDMPGIIDIADWDVPQRILRNRPVMGRYSRDNRLKFPSTSASLLAAYPEDPFFDVRIMGGSCVSSVLGDRPLPDNWTMLKYNEMPVKEFLAVIDFFVYFDNDEIVEAFGRSILEAMAAGCVVIVDNKFRGVFGDGVIYTRPQEVASLVCSIHADPDRYRELSGKARHCVRQLFSHDSYIVKMQKFIGNTP